MHKNLIDAWPPAYTLKKSQRAKRLLLKISAQRGLEIIVPTAYRKAYHIPSLLSEHRAWIEKQLFKIKSYSDASAELPKNLTLPMLEQNHQLEYHFGHSAANYIEAFDDKLRLYLQQENMQEVSQLLRYWVGAKAKLILPELLRAYSHEYRLPFSKVILRWQKTRWGSCNANKVISLNCGLLLLPKPLVRYVLIHELCHTQHLDHSAKFWQKVAECDPKWREHKQQLRLVQASLPAWARG